MPMIRARYPEDWELIALRVKRDANWCCEQCQRPCRMPDESVDVLIERVRGWRSDFKPAEFYAAPRRYLLTVAHLDQQPENCDRKNLKALCTVCHLRHDRQFRGKQRALLREWFGQLRLEVGDES